METEGGPSDVEGLWRVGEESEEASTYITESSSLR